MTDSGKKDFALEMVALAEVLNKKLTPTLLHSYFEDLKEYELPDVLSAIRLARKELAFFPKPVEIIGRILNIRAERTALQSAGQNSLMGRIFPSEDNMTEEARRSFFQFVNGLADGIQDGRANVLQRVSDTEQQIHEERKRLAKERLEDEPSDHSM